MFDIGQKVICINNNLDNGDDWYGPKLVLNKIYTVRDYVPDPYNEYICIRLVELIRDKGCDHVGFRINRFAPINDKKTDISVFEKILDEINSRTFVLSV